MTIFLIVDAHNYKLGSERACEEILKLIWVLMESFLRGNYTRDF